MGFIEKQWKVVQQKYLIETMDQSELQAIVQADRWSIIVQTCLWRFLSAVWKNRCQVIHGKGKDNKYYKAREELITKVHQMHRNNMEVSASDRHIFSQEKRICVSSI